MEEDKAAGPPSELLKLLTRLHRHKDAAYGDAWRTRGEIVGIFGNLARKYDRLVIGLSEERPAGTDPLADTAADLCVYAAKYLTWLAETQPQAFDGRPPSLDATNASAERGTEALERIFAALADWELASQVGPPTDLHAAWARVREAFAELEGGLMAQADAGPTSGDLLRWSRKVDLAWMLTDASAWLLARLTDEDPARLDGLRVEVSVMDQRAPS